MLWFVGLAALQVAIFRKHARIFFAVIQLGKGGEHDKGGGVFFWFNLINLVNFIMLIRSVFYDQVQISLQRKDDRT